MSNARCATPFAFPFTPLGLSLFDIDPSRILSILHHQTWLAEEALRSRGLLSAPKDFSHRFTSLSDLLSKDYAQPNHAYKNTADILSGVASTASTSTSNMSNATSSSNLANNNTSNGCNGNNNCNSKDILQLNRSTQKQQQYKQKPQKTQQKPQQQQQHIHPFNIRYPSPAGFFQYRQPQQQQSHKRGEPSPNQTATSTFQSQLQDSVGITITQLNEELSRNADSGNDSRDDDVTIVEPTPPPPPPPMTPQPQEACISGSSIGPTGSVNSVGGVGPINASSATQLYKESLEQLLQQQQRRSRHSLTLSNAGVIVDTGLRSYTQLLLSGPNTSSCTDTSSCKEKSSSSSTSSTPPPSAALSQMLKSPSDSSSSLFSETIEEETRCVVCNAHFPNVWLLEQHAALQHPHVGPGEEKSFICEQCGQSYRYRSAYAKHKEQNHRARLPADKLFTCDVCGMQFRYLKSFKKHRLNHALERLHGKKNTGGIGGLGRHLTASATATSCIAHTHEVAQDVVTSSQETAAADEGEDLRINIKRERDVDGSADGNQPDGARGEEEQDNTIDSAGIMAFNDNNSSTSASTSVTESNITSSDVIYSTNKRLRLLSTPHMETDPSYQHHQQHSQHHQQQQQQHHLQQLQQRPLPVHLQAALSQQASPSHQAQLSNAAVAAAAMAGAAVAAGSSSISSLSSLNSITSLINAERIPSEQFLGLNPQEASILNFLRVDAAERQRDKRPPTSRFACPFCGKCVRSKENLKLHVRKHTGERPFVCLFCGRAFGGKSDLTRHLRIHTGERPYHCESCGKCFARADYLSKHLTTHIHNAPR